MTDLETSHAAREPGTALLTGFGGAYRAAVAGGTGGIGGAFVRLLESDPSCSHVAALGRTTRPGLDLADEASIAEAARDIGEAGEISLLIDATGLLHDGAMMSEKALDALDADAMMRSFAVNAAGPALLLKHFRRIMPARRRAIFATLSARVGSIGDNGLGGWYSYRASKAALNMIVKTASIEMARRNPEAVLLALHPGTVETRLSEPFRGSRDLFTPDESAAKMLRVINDAGPDQSGSFLAYDGTVIAW